MSSPQTPVPMRPGWRYACSQIFGGRRCDAGSSSRGLGAPPCGHPQHALSRRRCAWWGSSAPLQRRRTHHLRTRCDKACAESGFVEGQNLTIKSRWADGHYDRLPALATDLVRQRVAVIIPIGGAPATIAAQAATSTIPIVFNMTADPVALGVVASLNRPGGNVTGVAIMGVELEPKRLELLREITLNPSLIGLLINPSNPQAQGQLREFEGAAGRIGQQVLVASASAEQDVRLAFAKLAEQKVGALLLGQDPFFASQPELLVAMAEFLSNSNHQPLARAHDPGGLDELRSQPAGCVSSDRRLCRKGSQRG